MKSGQGVQHADCGQAYLATKPWRQQPQGRSRATTSQNQRVVESVGCPFCEAGPGKPCRRKNGRPRATCHQGRWVAWDKAQGRCP